jgi:GMP synthase-like glutamine amidotransferase
MKALFIQHDHVSPLGPVGERFEHHGFEIETLLVVPENKYREPNVQVSFPDYTSYDVIIPLGSPWGAWDDACIGNWLLPELEWLKRAIEANTPVLGICFGGQLMARALGGSVAPGPRPELGWTYIFSDDQSLVSNGPWFQFHYDYWKVPPVAKEIARTALASQAFVYRRSLALQFHPELDVKVLEGWLIWDGNEELAEDGQDPQIVLEQTRALAEESRLRAFELVDNFLTKVALVLPEKASK